LRFWRPGRRGKWQLLLQISASIATSFERVAFNQFNAAVSEFFQQHLN
jgi:hypothetical protein